MATRVAGMANGCAIQWKIESISSCCWLSKGKPIAIGSFIIDALGGTKWNLGLCTKGYIDGWYICLYLQRAEYCSGPDVIEVSYQLAIISNAGSILKEDTSSKISFTKGKISGFPRFEAGERIFTTEREVFLPDDTLTVQCTIWNTEEKPVETKSLYCYLTTFKASCKWFVWKFNQSRFLFSNESKNFKHKSIDLNISLILDFARKLNIEMVSFDNALCYISRDATIITTKGERKHLGFKEHLSGHLLRGIISPLQHFPNTLMEIGLTDFTYNFYSIEFIFSTVERFDSLMTSSKMHNKPDIGKMESKNFAALIEDLKNIYIDSTLSDTELRTSTHIFPAHKVILSARSPVFKSMLSYDMMEKNSGHIDITDFEDDTIRRMLLYMYTDSLEDLQFESAFELYKIADKYQILSLKNRCSTFLKEHLCPTNACEVLTLAALYSDDDLKSYVQDYILQQRTQIFSSQKWKDFMNTHLHLAAEVMYKKISKE